MAVIHALERCNPAERHQIETVLRDRAFNGVTHADILTILNRYGSLEYASKEPPVTPTRKERHLHFPDSEIKRALLWHQNLSLQEKSSSSRWPRAFKQQAWSNPSCHLRTF